MKKLVNLTGAKTLNRKEQKEIFGGVEEHDGPLPHGDGGNGTVMCHDGYMYSPIDCEDYYLMQFACRDHGGASICTG